MTSPARDDAQPGMSEANAPSPLSDDAVALREKIAWIIAKWDTYIEDIHDARLVADAILQAIEGEG